MENAEPSAPSQLATDEVEKKQRRKLQNRLNQRARSEFLYSDA